MNHVFTLFDGLAEEAYLEKIKTIGDAYMVVGGLYSSDRNHILSMASFSLAILAGTRELSKKLDVEISLRVGMNIGPATSGVIGTKKFSYDIWGDTVNTASRMESSGTPGMVQVTEATYRKLMDQFSFEERGVINIKGKGEMRTFYLIKEN